MLIESVILVDNIDNEIGICEKLEAHRKGLLHRAISVFVFRKIENGYELLLQQRNKKKYHSGGLWTNTSCSHPRPKEQTIAAAQRRLKEEMGFETPLSYAGSFLYTAIFSHDMVENEFDHVFIGFYEDQTISPDPAEVADYKWVDTASLLIDIDKNSKKYTAWLAPALDIALKKLDRIDLRY